MARLRVLFVVSECVPLIKSGGLGDVAGALPPSLARRGHDVRVVMPRYRATKAYPSEDLGLPLDVSLGGGTRYCGVHRGFLPEGEVPVYLLEHDVLFDRDGLYGDQHGDFGDNALRFALLSRGALALADALGFEPDIIHINDWQTSLVPIYAAAAGSRAATVLSIHNLGYQGWFAPDELGGLGVPGHIAQSMGYEHNGVLNLLKGGILSSTLVSTVSPRYAQEIQTLEGGAGLHDALYRRRGSVIGILNGIDEKVWGPEGDRHLDASFNADDLSGKAVCKRELQRELGLPLREHVPLFGMISRFAHQKGIDIMAGALERLLFQDVQFAILGKGEEWAERLFGQLSATMPNVAAKIAVDERMAHRIEAGADFFLMPSRYEPCGLNQMYSQRYGTLPIVRGVGGLLDTVRHGRDGYVFHELSGEALARTAMEAVGVFRHDPVRHRAMQKTAMTKRMGWNQAASQYEALYRLALRRVRGG
ncbi:MAG: glycogen/starch synthase [Myxococcota bacterium]